MMVRIIISKYNIRWMSECGIQNCSEFNNLKEVEKAYQIIKIWHGITD